MNFEKCLERFKENLVIPSELNQGVALVHAERTFNYLEQENETTPTENNDVEKYEY